jgi:hypothetical protein
VIEIDQQSGSVGGRMAGLSESISHDPVANILVTVHISSSTGTELSETPTSVAFRPTRSFAGPHRRLDRKVGLVKISQEGRSLLVKATTH